MSTERDELIGILWDNAVADRVRAGKDLKLVPVVRAKAEAVADAILAAGYRKQDVVIEWGAAHANGVVARTYRTDRAAQAFVKSMAEVGHEMRVLRREYRPATYTVWEPVK